MITYKRQQPNTFNTKLRYDWTKMTVQSPLAKDILTHQRNCSLPLGNYYFRNRFGLGSDLHLWTQGVCNAMRDNVRIRSALMIKNQPWIYWDEEECKVYSTKRDSILCYFPESELLCPEDVELSETDLLNHTTISISASKGCQSLLQKYGESNPELGLGDVRAAGIEYLFSKLSTTVIQEAERQLNLVFPHGVPEHLITVHMRWGDKKKEMKLRRVGEYVNAVKRILEQQKLPSNKAAVFLATEDPMALKQFTTAVPNDWKVYVDQYYTEMLPFRVDEYNGNPKMSKNLSGKTGLTALGSLLVAMEANHFVLTTASNWSRLMDELRKQVLDPRCNKCTSSIDLKAPKPGDI